ncbi:unnamed protein product [Phytophthora lilii]|uniref:Unnamed protein product n=1 Tax=Phytophthora lilii TaxID=2077276 RepID=A0A9W7DD97_9STRA|nr:unnamed protein product [Phytophthora lilii]
MGLRCVSLWLALLFAAVCWQIHGLPRDDAGEVESALRLEIQATKQQLELYRRKKELLGDALTKLRTQLGHKTNHSASSSGESGSASSATSQRRQRYRDAPQIFSDWFEHEGVFSLEAAATNSTRVFSQLISFRPNSSPMGRRQQAAARRKTSADDEPPLQFLLVLDPSSTMLSLFHPSTHELVWQHSLDLRSPSARESFRIADMFFVSDRSAHLAVLSTSGDLALFKLRLWHSRRIISGDARRLKPLRELEEDYLQCAAGQDTLHALSPWMFASASSLTSPAPGRYLHVDVERVFVATLHPDRRYNRGKVVVVAQYYRVFVVASDNLGRHLSFLHGENGSFIEDIDTQAGPHDGGVVQLQPIQSSRGLVALATQDRVFFMDATAPFLVPVMCEAPGRHALTSLVADPLRPSIVYAGTSTGRALVYKLHNIGAWRHRSDMSEHEPHGPVTCTLVDQLMPRRPPLLALGHESHSIVQTLPGFLVLGTGPRLVLYQLSGSSDEVRPTYLSEHSMLGSFVKELDRLSALRVVGISATKDLVEHPTAFAVLVADSNSPDRLYRLDVYESRVPPSGTNLDLSWIRVPAMMICALAAMFWQQKGRVAYSAGGRGSFHEAELAGLLSGRGVRLPSMASAKRGGLNSNRRASDWY